MANWAGRRIQSVAGVMTVPWPSFVAAFLYYTLLTALVLSGVSPAWTLVAGAYAGPVVVYALGLTWRLVDAMRSTIRRPVPARLLPAHAPLVWQ